MSLLGAAMLITLIIGDAACFLANRRCQRYSRLVREIIADLEAGTIDPIEAEWRLMALGTPRLAPLRRLHDWPCP
jgi:hypothetical protein